MMHGQTNIKEHRMF